MKQLQLSSVHRAFKRHETQADVPLEITAKEVEILRELGKRYSEIASLSIQCERKEMWRKLNDLEKVKPLIWIDEICWHEMDVKGELQLKTSSKFCQRIETELRRTIYQWEQMQGDMVVEPIIYSPYIIRNTGVGLDAVAEVVMTDQENDVVSRHFHNQFIHEADIGKIKIPKISFSQKRTEQFLQAYKIIFDGIIQIEKRGSPGFWFSPWDDLAVWMGAEEILTSLMLRPEFLHKLMERLTEAYLEALDQFEKLKLLASNNCNCRVGSGAFGYTGYLPTQEQKNHPVTAKDIWGSSAAQIFGSVSPKMHEEFGLNYEIKWLERFGRTYYGCCEPLHNKLDILKKIPNLRKISISPWAKLEEAAAMIADRYVISLKPSPAVLASPSWHPERVREDLKCKLKAAEGCNVEIILKDISTVNREPHRLWEWAKVAIEVTERYS